MTVGTVQTPALTSANIANARVADQFYGSMSNQRTGVDVKFIGGNRSYDNLSPEALLRIDQFNRSGLDEYC